MKRAIAAVAERVVLAVDASKLDGGTEAGGVAVGLDWEQIDVLVTELDPADPRLVPYRDLADVR